MGGACETFTNRNPRRAEVWQVRGGRSAGGSNRKSAAAALPLSLGRGGIQERERGSQRARESGSAEKQRKNTKIIH